MRLRETYPKKYEDKKLTVSWKRHRGKKRQREKETGGERAKVTERLGNKDTQGRDAEGERKSRSTKIQLG